MKSHRGANDLLTKLQAGSLKATDAFAVVVLARTHFVVKEKGFPMSFEPGSAPSEIRIWNGKVVESRRQQWNDVRPYP